LIVSTSSFAACVCSNVVAERAASNASCSSHSALTARARVLREKLGVVP
jgi:hypothetical protein